MRIITLWDGLVLILFDDHLMAPKSGLQLLAAWAGRFLALQELYWVPGILLQAEDCVTAIVCLLRLSLILILDHQPLSITTIMKHHPSNHY